MRILSGKKILLGPSSFSDEDSLPMERLRETDCEIINNPFKRKLTKAELLNLLGGGVSGLIAGLEPLDREVLEFSSLKVISRCGAGLSNIDLKATGDMGIIVRSTPDAPTAAVAELTVGALLTVMRMIPQMNENLHEGKWRKKIGMQVKDKTVVIIGFGRIGRYVAKLIRSFEVKIIAVDPFLKGKVDGVQIKPIDEALPQADIITIHSSGKDCVLGDNEFRLIKKGAFLLNAARGNVIDEAALINGLKDGKIRGAWIDTFREEPYEGPLKDYQQVILTPHAGSYTRECRWCMEMEAVENLIQAFRKKE